MSTKTEAYDLADVLREGAEFDGVTLGPTDALLAAEALAAYARRFGRRAMVARTAIVAAVISVVSAVACAEAPVAAFAVDFAYNMP